MKRKYCLIRNYGRMRPGHFIYTVYVGSSQREQVLLALLSEYCADVGYYFKLWSAEVDSSITLAEKPFKKSRSVFKSPFVRASIGIRELYGKIIDGTIENFEDRYTESQFSLWMQFNQSTEWCQLCNHKKCTTSCHPYRRKNLSRNMRTCDEVIVIASVAYLVLVVTGKLLEYVCI